VLNGGLRELLLDPWIGERSGHVVSTILLCLVILLVAWLAILWIGARTDEEALRVGLLWLVLTVVFEFLAGHYLFGNSWEALLADYNLFAGRIWPLVLVADLLAPLLALRLRGPGARS
jgi:hypothetical protein